MREQGNRRGQKKIWAVILILTVALEIPCSCYLTKDRENIQSGREDLAVDLSDTQMLSDTESVLTRQTPKQNAGDAYTVAGDYREVYEALRKAETERKKFSFYDAGVKEDGAEAAAEGGVMDVREAPESQVTEISDTAESSYSVTNVMTEGVDESDIVKTDGSYLYVQADNEIKIIDVRGEEMKEAGVISLSGSGTLLEMYAEGDLLCVIAERDETDMEEETEDVYRFDTKQVTVLETYNISDRTNPVQTGTVTQDGAYKTSRKIGDVVYLFTQTGMERPAMPARKAAKSAGGWIPLINGEPVAADSIYLSEEAYSALVASSVNVKQPEKVVDQMMILNSNANIYVSREALYLYHNNYSDSRVYTAVAKFSLKNGNMDGVGACTANGEVYDSFAIHENKGKLRLLTTDWTRDENGLYLFDEKLELTGKLEGLAPGEQIYAARYFGDTAYFVTYRNTDPLFAVDLTDEKNPKVLSELKISGFSEYLHFWGTDKLLGIGYETDPDTGEQKGIKLTMFDISDPADLKTISSCVLKGIDYSPALYEYKAVLADAAENLIGFAVTEYQYREDKSSYELFAWEENKFENLLTASLNAGYGKFIENCRGIYIGKNFYLSDGERLRRYDRENDYQLLQEYEL